MDNNRRTLTGVLLLGLILASAAVFFLGWLTGEVLEGDTLTFDDHARAVVHSIASPGVTKIMLAFTDIGSVIELGCTVAVVVITFWLIRWRRAAVLLVVTMIGATLLVGALKIAFHRPRPTPYFGIQPPTTFSYPSGHALLSFVFFSTVAALSTPRTRSRGARAVIWIVAVVLIAMIGLSRIYLGVHYPSDVIAGYLTAFIWVFAVYWGDRWNRRQCHIRS